MHRCRLCTTFTIKCVARIISFIILFLKELLLCYFSGLNFLLMTPIEQPDTNQSTKNDVHFWETLPLIWALSAFSVNARLRPSPPPRPPPATPLRCDWLPSGRACCSITIHGKSGLVHVDKSRKMENLGQVNRDRRP